MFHNVFPWAGIVKSTPVTISAESTTLPSDFIMDVRDGLLITTPSTRLRRWSLPRHIQAGLSLGSSTGTPKRYTITPPSLLVYPTPDVAYAGKLWYYALPTVLGPTTVPNFPSDWVLVEYVRFRGLEWGNRAPAGSAEQFAAQAVSVLRRSGLAFESEVDAIPLDADSFRGVGGQNDYSWMGQTTL